MSNHWTDWPDEILNPLRSGVAIPANPLALKEDRSFDAHRQKVLARYYIDAGSGGLAVGVHTTQFEIREAGLYQTVLQTAIEAARDWSDRPLVYVAGIAGTTQQAVAEADLARNLGYHAGLLSLAALKGASEDDLIAHCRTVGEQIPLIGFYLQPAVGGIMLTPSFWRRFAEIDNVVAIKMAPFNRYRTLDVVRGVVEAEAEGRITLYTGNDDHIVLDLVTPYELMRHGSPVSVRIKGGLLGHWSVWTRSAVSLLERCQEAVAGGSIDDSLLALDSQVTDCNSAFFDVANGFRGCIAGCHEVLHRQRLLEGTWCLNPQEALSPGQKEEIDRVQAAYPHLNDDDFVAANLDRWLEA